VIGAAVESHSYALAIIAMMSAVVSAFLYLRVVVAMYMTDDDAETRPAVRIPIGAGIALGLAVIFTIGIGILPQRVVHWADRATPVVLDNQ
jgi:NADH-quinone oxidoreductase subunit N